MKKIILSILFLCFFSSVHSAQPRDDQANREKQLMLQLQSKGTEAAFFDGVPIAVGLGISCFAGNKILFSKDKWVDLPIDTAAFVLGALTLILKYHWRAATLTRLHEYKQLMNELVELKSNKSNETK